MNGTLAEAKRAVLTQLRDRPGFPRLIKADDDEDPERIAAELSLAELSALLALSDPLGDVANDGGRRFVAQINVPGQMDMFGQVNERAVAYAQARAAELVTGITDATRNELSRLIAQALEDNVGLDEMAERIGAAYAFSDERAELIARTEVAAANQHGALEGMRAAQDLGITIKKVWLPDGEACEECQSNGDAGPIDLDDVFPTGDSAPPAHPNCRCDMASEIEEDEQ